MMPTPLDNGLINETHAEIEDGEVVSPYEESQSSVDVVVAPTVVCDECGALVPKPLLAQHQLSSCIISPHSTCWMSRKMENVCAFNLRDSDHITRQDCLAHLETRPSSAEAVSESTSQMALHLLFLMDTVEEQSLMIRQLRDDLSCERAERLAFQSGVENPLTKRQHLVLSERAPQNPDSIVNDSFTLASGKLLERRAMSKFHRLNGSSVDQRFSIAADAAPLIVSQTWNKRALIGNPQVAQLKSLLNKLTATNQSRIFDAVLNVFESSTSHLEELTVLLFEKILDDTFYCWLFADLVTKLSSWSVDFRSKLLTLCQKEFESKEEIASSVTAPQSTPFLSEIETQKRKKRKKASILLLAELYIRKVVFSSIIFLCLNELLGELDLTSSTLDSATECLCQLLDVVGPQLDNKTESKTKLDSLVNKISERLENSATEGSTRRRFLWQEVCEKRVRSWRKRENEEENRVRASSKVVEQNSPLSFSMPVLQLQLQPRSHMESLHDTGTSQIHQLASLTAVSISTWKPKDKGRSALN